MMPVKNNGAMEIIATGGVLRYDGSRLTTDENATLTHDGNTLTIRSNEDEAGQCIVNTFVFGGGQGFMCNSRNVKIGRNVRIGTQTVGTQSASRRRKRPSAPGARVDEPVAAISSIVLSGQAEFHWIDTRHVQPQLTVMCSGQSAFEPILRRIDSLVVQASGQAQVSGRRQDVVTAVVQASGQATVVGLHCGRHTVSASGQSTVTILSHDNRKPVELHQAEATVRRCRVEDCPVAEATSTDPPASPRTAAQPPKRRRLDLDQF